MAKHIIKRYLPSPEKIASTPGLGFLRHRLEDPSLWHLNRRSASGAMFWGLWFAFLPIPFQMFPAAVAALLFRLNLPLCVALVWLTNPLTMLPCVYVGYSIGALLLNRPLLDSRAIHDLLSQLSDLFGEKTDSITASEALRQHIEPFLLGMLVTGFLAGCLGYLGMNWYWRYHVRHAWQKRQQRQLKA